MAPTAADSETSAILGGTTDTADPAVVMLQANVSGGYSWCTAEIVSPHVLMTAAHCVSPQTVGTVTSFQVFIGYDNASQMNDPSKWLAVQETHYNMAFDANNLQGGQDVAVVILSQPTTITPITMNTTALVSSDVSQSLRLVGYGITSGSDTTGTTAGTKRVVSTPLKSYDSNFVRFGTSTKGTCEGDSGGPAFLTIGGQEVIVGITSYGQVGCTNGTSDTRVDTVAEPFVAPYIAQFDPGGGGGNPDLATGGGGGGNPDLATGGGGGNPDLAGGGSGGWGNGGGSDGGAGGGNGSGGGGVKMLGSGPSHSGCSFGAGPESETGAIVLLGLLAIGGMLIRKKD
jgi:secreted trypsin-like serine protease